MAGYYRTKVVGITITVSCGMPARRETLKGRVIETAWKKTWRTLLLERTTAGSIVHVRMKHIGVHTLTQIIHIRNKKEVE